MAIDKKGKQYDFGRSSASQIADTPARTFRWALDRYMLLNSTIRPPAIPAPK
ncbi:MAG: hypothetical protein IPJ40_12030 [Saprospirales bacterium]|nr:hypothetical protein [Saprospirales bacterium]